MSPFYCPHLLLVFTSFITPFCESIRILTRSTLPTLQAKQRLWPLVVLYEKKPNATGGSELDEEISGHCPRVDWAVFVNGIWKCQVQIWAVPRRAVARMRRDHGILSPLVNTTTIGMNALEIHV
ncbi:hypothetical protein B0J15DRAFT_23162 [Fusarium solani]|uniref:Secreted protein n=1 Tax=Fusarium solani TaxID=169388 RepID=A0A9P9L6G0_FUSSL|nr:uncharacterized protein B0J15DRAFT_23162 [Fusarium solani]KAH7275730.1 hypothetical protein B0J15DRAFT_23162 [Fusarium solani]